jgi:hypothetical protein
LASASKVEIASVEGPLHLLLCFWNCDLSVRRTPEVRKSRDFRFESPWWSPGSETRRRTRRGRRPGANVINEDRKPGIIVMIWWLPSRGELGSGLTFFVKPEPKPNLILKF